MITIGDMVIGTIICMVIIGATTIGIGDLVGTVGMDQATVGDTIIMDGTAGTETIMDTITAIIRTTDGIMATMQTGMVEDEAITQVTIMEVEAEMLQLLEEAVLIMELEVT